MTAPKLDDTIARLVADMKPVRRVWSPARRSAIWISLLLALLATLLWRFGAMRGFAKEFTRATNAIELTAAVLTGVLALVAAFYMAMPDRSQRWVWLPVPTLAVWVATTSFGCAQAVAERGSAALYTHLGWPCFIFISVVSLPLGVALLLLLRRGAPIQPVRVAMLAGLGVAALAAAALHALHPLSVALSDIGMHAVAILGIVAVFGAVARPALDRM